MDKEEFKKAVKKSRLSEKEMKEFFKKVSNIKDPTRDHSLALRALTNPLRRNILEYINIDIKTLEDLKNKFNLDDSQLNYHLDMLKQTLYILDSEDGWKLTPRGIGFLENAQLSV
ncbi:MAG: ArsR family transcriptional regulator [Promethearchaeota archaeon]|nr:MAG: ArsR family transcriptional regulator [Candidatus Lokiarchaeota archaeon]